MSPVQPTPQQAVLQRAREESIRRSDRATDRAFRLELGETPTYYPGRYDEKAHREVSFFQDLYMANTRPEAHPHAVARLNEHRERSTRILRQHAERISDGMGGTIPESRATTSATLGGLIPPTYMGELYAKAPRNGRVFADGANRQPLPETGMTVLIPRITTATAVGVQATENTTVTTQDPAETDLSVNVRTLAGYLPVSRQSLERGSYSDQVLFEDLVARYYALLDSQCLNGTGGSGQLLGSLQTAGIVSSTTSTATIASIYSKTVDCIQQVNTQMGGLGYVADRIFMSPRRWTWLCAQVDTQGRPLMGLSPNPSMNVFGYQDSARDAIGYQGVFAGLPVYTTNNMPINLGAGTNEDRIIVQASPAILLFERSSDPIQLAFDQTAATSLQIQLIVFGYVAFTASRYPSATGVVSGSGLGGVAF